MNPNFIIIGAMKSGTTTLWKYLSLHPEAWVAKIKEVDFFSSHWELGWEWYESHFETSTAKAIGEASTTYSRYPWFPEVPERMAARLPRVKLIYLVRDPIERIQSMYVHCIHMGHEKRSFDQAMSSFENNDYICMSLYYLQMTRYLAYFVQEQILVISLDDLQDRPAETLKQVYNFIGINPDLGTTQFDVVENESSEIRRRQNKIGKMVHRLPYQNYVLYYLPKPLRRWHRNITSTAIAKPQVSAELRQRLVERIKPDTDRLRALVGQPFSSWSL